MPLGQDAGNGVQVHSMSAKLVPAPSGGLPVEVAVPDDAPLFIVMNAGSGKHEGEDVRLVVETTLTSAGRQFSIDEVEDPEKLGAVAAAVVERARARKGVVVAAGGDGTINTVAAATLGSGCPFGVLPLGTFNYFSRAHGIPSDPRTACQMLLGRRAFAVQVGLVNDRIFLVNGSIGLYPDMLEEREEAKSQLGRSRWVAMGAALSTLLRPHHDLRVEVELESGRKRFVTPTLFVGNNHLQLERVGIPANDLTERHRLVAVVLEPVSVVGMLLLIVRALFGRLAEAQSVHCFSFRRMTVRPRLRRRRRFKVATDGEVEWLPAPLEFRVAPHPLLLLRPAEPGPDPG
jgi:diacylglycerol kinase family enzyme